MPEWLVAGRDGHGRQQRSQDTDDNSRARKVERDKKEEDKQRQRRAQDDKEEERHNQSVGAKMKCGPIARHSRYIGAGQRWQEKKRTEADDGHQRRQDRGRGASKDVRRRQLVVARGQGKGNDESRAQEDEEEVESGKAVGARRQPAVQLLAVDDEEVGAG